MDQRFHTSPALHRVFHDGRAPSHITFGATASPPGGLPRDQEDEGTRLQQHEQVGHQTTWRHPQRNLDNSWSSFPQQGQPGWWVASPAGAMPPLQVEQCASKTASGLPAGMSRGREPPVLKTMTLSGSSSGSDSKGRLPQSEISRLCSKLEAIGDKRSTQHNFVARAVRDVAPAVVRIDAQKRIAVADATSIFDILFGVSGGGGSHQRKQVVTGTGSGFCIDSSGIVLTNAHVVEGADSLGIQLQNGKNYKGHVVGMHSELDLAVVKVDVKDDRLPSVPLGNSSSLMAGDWAIALGNPLGLQHSCTLGIISSLDRSTCGTFPLAFAAVMTTYECLRLPHPATFRLRGLHRGEGGWDWMRQSLLQTDAAINQGNSGGPLLDENGKVIGIITSRALGADGIGFAVPIDQAVEQIPHILRNKPQVTPCMGCKLATLKPSLAVELNASPEFGAVVPKVEGVVVVEVLTASPASKSGIKKGDVIVSCDGSKTIQIEQVQKCVRRTKVGQQLQLQLRRGAHDKVSATVKLGEAERVVREAAKAKIAARGAQNPKQGGLPHGFFLMS